MDILEENHQIAITDITPIFKLDMVNADFVNVINSHGLVGVLQEGILLLLNADHNFFTSIITFNYPNHSPELGYISVV